MLTGDVLGAIRVLALIADALVAIVLAGLVVLVVIGVRMCATRMVAFSVLVVRALATAVFIMRAVLAVVPVVLGVRLGLRAHRSLAVLQSQQVECMYLKRKVVWTMEVEGRLSRYRSEIIETRVYTWHRQHSAHAA